MDLTFSLIAILFVLSLFLLALFIIAPLFKNGIGRCLYVWHNMPLLRYPVDFFIKIKAKSISAEWSKKIKNISESEIPKIDWGEPIILDLRDLYILDHKSDDVRCILNTIYHDYPRDESALWLSHFNDDFIFKPEIAPMPDYDYSFYNKTLNIKTSQYPDSWIYLVSHKLMPSRYALDFLFMTRKPMDETLQINICANSLAKRIRYIIKNNLDIRFDIVDKGFFLASYNQECWGQFKHPYSISLGEYHHVRLEVIDNIFVLYIDDKMVIGNQVDCKLWAGHFFLIFWNGINNVDIMDISIKDLKLIIPKNPNIEFPQ